MQVLDVRFQVPVMSRKGICNPHQCLADFFSSLVSVLF